MFPVSAGALQASTPEADEHSVEFVVGICTGPDVVAGNFEADLKPIAGTEPGDLKQPWLPEDGPAVSGRLPAGCEPAGAGFTLEVARDTRHYTGRAGVITGADGRSAAALSSLPHSDRLAAGQDVWAQPISPDPGRYRPIAFRCGNDARNGDLTEYISGRHEGRQHCVAFYVEVAQTPRSTRPTEPTQATAPTAAPSSTSTPAVTIAPATPTTETSAVPGSASTTTASVPAPTTSTAPVTTTAVPTGPSSRAPGTAPVPATQPSESSDAAGSNGTNASPSPVDDQSIVPDVDEAGSASTNTSDATDADSADLRPRVAAVPVTRPEPTTPTTTQSSGAATGSGRGDTTNASSLSRPESGTQANDSGRAESTVDLGDDAAQEPTDGETALGRKAADRAVDLILAIEVRGLTRENEAASVTPWTDTVRAEVRCGDGPPRTLTLEPGEEPGFTLSLGMKFAAAEATECTHRLLTDGLDDESLGGVLASVDGKSTRRGEAQTVVLHPDDPARTFQYELVYVDADEKLKRVAAGDDLSRGADPDRDSSGDDTAFSGERPVDRGLGRTGERIPAPTLVALGMIFVVGLALSIAQSSKAV